MGCPFLPSVAGGFAAFLCETCRVLIFRIGSEAALTPLGGCGIYRLGWRVFSSQARDQDMHLMLNELALIAVLLVVVAFSSRF